MSVSCQANCVLVLSLKSYWTCISRNAIRVPVGKIQSCFTIKVGGNQGTLSFSFLLFLVFLVIFSFTKMQFIVKENSPSQIFDTGITLSALNWTCHRWLFLDFILFFLEEKGTFTYFITWSLVWHITRNWRNIPLSFIRSTSKVSNWFYVYELRTPSVKHSSSWTDVSLSLRVSI